MTAGLNSRPKEWSRPPEPHPPDAGCWCSRRKRRPYVSLIWCSTPSGHGNGLRPWIRNNDRRAAHEPVNLPLDCKQAHVSGYSRHAIRAACAPRVSCVRFAASAEVRLSVLGRSQSAMSQQRRHPTRVGRQFSSGNRRPAMFCGNGFHLATRQRCVPNDRRLRLDARVQSFPGVPPDLSRQGHANWSGGA